MQVRLPFDSRRNQLVRAALERAESDGIDAVTIRRVADDAGVSVGMVHYCFENKEDLMSAMIETNIDELAAGLRMAFAYAATVGEQAADGATGTVALSAHLQAGVRTMWQLIELTPSRQRLAYETICFSLRRRDDPTNPSARLAKVHKRLALAAAAEFLAGCAQQTGTEWTTPVERVARLCLSLLDGVVIHWLVERDTEAAWEDIDQIIAMVVQQAR